MAITLRDILDEDEGFLREVYACARAPELAQVPWNDEQREVFLSMQFEAQHSYYHAEYPNADYKIIIEEGERIGRIYVYRGAPGIRILDITILPAFRNKGYGSWIIRTLMDEGTRLDTPLSIWVEHFNPSRSLFERLGFSQIQEDGYNLLLEWHPAK